MGYLMQYLLQLPRHGAAVPDAPQLGSIANRRG